MIPLVNRPYAGENDLERVIDLLLTDRIVHPHHIEHYPTVWRLRQLLATRLWEPQRDARIWEDAARRCMGFAFLSRRRREDVGDGLECILHPQAPQTELFAEMLGWAQTRSRERAGERAETIGLGTAFGEGESDKIAVLEQHGFTRVDGYNLYFACSLDRSLPQLTVPEGFSVRPLSGKDELDAYQALYGFAAVTREHRLELIESPEYHHVVAVAADETLVAYCECSISRAEWKRSGRRVGWIDYIGTRSEFQRRGLGQAIMLAALQQLQTWGTDTAMLITRDDNTKAHNVFCAVGFQVADHDIIYSKQIEPAQIG